MKAYELFLDDVRGINYYVLEYIKLKSLSKIILKKVIFSGIMFVIFVIIFYYFLENDVVKIISKLLEAAKYIH